MFPSYLTDLESRICESEESNSNHAELHTESRGSLSPRIIYHQPPDNPFEEDDQGSCLTPVPTTLDIHMGHKHFSLVPPKYNLHSPHKPKLREQEQHNLALLVDVVMNNTPDENIPHELKSEATKHREDHHLNSSLSSMPTAKQFLIEVLGAEFDDLVTKLWAYQPSPATSTPEMQLIQTIKYTLTDFHGKCRGEAWKVDHERTFFVDHIVPTFTYFGKQTGLLRFFWCEKAMRHRDLSTMNTSHWSKGNVKSADGLGLHDDKEYLIMESSSTGYEENLEHTVDDSLKQIESTTGALKCQILHHLSAKYATLQNVKILGIQCVSDKMTLTSTSLEAEPKYKFLELRSANIPTSWNKRKCWMKVFEMLATIHVILSEQRLLADELEDQANGLVEVSPNETARHVLLKKKVLTNSIFGNLADELYISRCH